MEATQGPKTLRDAYAENLALSESIQKNIISILVSGSGNRSDIIFKIKDEWFIDSRLRRIYNLTRDAIVEKKEIINHIISNGEKSQEIIEII